MTSVTFSPDGVTLAAGFRRDWAVSVSGPFHGVRFWDVVQRKWLVDKGLAEKSDVTSVAFSPDGMTVAAGYYGGVTLWDA